jgi:Na+/H+ antiporter NhaD/arsenite permease-like protein
MPSTPFWAVLPFVGYLLLIALVPTFFGRFWERNSNKLFVALLASSPVFVYLLAAPHGGALLGRAACDYLSFTALLAALFTISGGICLHGALAGSPLVNTAFLAAGSVLGSLVGTTGASVLLIRPLLRANERRARATHVVVFFIFIVSNGAGLLTPLGDPPLFLGFLRGVPFTWTLRLAPQWALVNGALLALFAVIDKVQFARERRNPALSTSIGSSAWSPSSSSSAHVAGAISATATCARPLK